ncbi:MAG: DUF354 domain-containing protein [Candidatus Atribacteria bacterium]|nr:DUF354 domain-containing protein [Candidatus Atribacteria bacterium]
MKLLFDLNHPAHFHLFRFVIDDLASSNTIIITAKEKDVLLSLLRRNGFMPIILQAEKRRAGLFFSAIGILKRDLKLFHIVLREQPDILIGTSISITHVGKLLKIPSLYFGEDGYKAVPLSYRFGYPFATNIISPKCVDVGKYNFKKIEYSGYHELSYLAPETFAPSEAIINKYGLAIDKPYFLLRFSALQAHHDTGKKGIDLGFALKIIKKLERHGRVLVSSEKILPQEINVYRLSINPEDIHHVMAFSRLLIGDSQTMAIESAVLGVPSIRYSSFAGQLMVLEELEHEYGLTFGFLPGYDDLLLQKIDELLKINKIAIAQAHTKMLSDKIDVRKFFGWLIKNYPESLRIIKENPSYQDDFNLNF